MQNFNMLKEYENIKLYHGDCMDLLKQTPDNYYSLALVDPPYGEMCNLKGGRKFNKMYKNSRKLTGLLRKCWIY